MEMKLAGGRRHRRIVYALTLCLAGLIATPVSAQQRPATTPAADNTASAFDEVDECDLLAAHPSDPERVAEGVADDAIVPRLALRACEAAVKRAPEEARFSFQFGRALLAADRRPAAAQQFERAAQRNHAAALAYLGDAYQFGHGVTADAARALDAYRKSSERGFKPAEAQIEMLTFDPARFITPIPTWLYQGEVTELSDLTRQPINIYLYGFVTTLAQDCQSLFPPAVMSRVLMRRYPEGWTPEADVSVEVMRVGPAGEYDARAFIRRHGCDGPVARDMAGQITRLLVLQ